MDPGVRERSVDGWIPQPGPQKRFVEAEAFEVVYGGARGGGKTDASLGDFFRHVLKWGPRARGLFVRRTRVALEPTIARAREIYSQAGARWLEQKSTFIWPHGARLSFRYLDKDSDADAYQGHDYTRVYVEELTQFADPRPVEKLKATLRSASGAHTGFRATCNPGGPGHTWVKARYIDAGEAPVSETFRNPFNGEEQELSRLFIPARLTDNPRLLETDPLYVAKLQQSGSAALVKAWLEGDWSVVEGAFFEAWSTARNVVAPFAIPDHWTRFRAFDWGSARPFSVGWWAVASEPFAVRGGLVLPRGALVRYREWYGSTGKPNEGLKLTAEAVAEGILKRESAETLAYGVADPSIFRQDGGPSIAERMRRAGVAFRPADNARVGRFGALGGWDQMRARIMGTEEGPMLAVFSTCRDFIRTVPVMQHDADRPEDLDTEAEDHVADEARYACMSRPWMGARAADPRNPPDLWGRTRSGGAGWKSA